MWSLLVESKCAISQNICRWRQWFCKEKPFKPCFSWGGKTKKLGRQLDGSTILPLGKGVFIGGKGIRKPMRGKLGGEIYGI